MGFGKVMFRIYTYYTNLFFFFFFGCDSSQTFTKTTENPALPPTLSVMSGKNLPFIFKKGLYHILTLWPIRIRGHY